MELKDEFTYEFKKPFQIAMKGDMVNATKITVRAPVGRVGNWVRILGQQISSAEMSAVEKLKDFIDTTKREKTEVKEETPEEMTSRIVQALNAGNADMELCMDALKNILSYGGTQDAQAYVNDTEPMTKAIFDDMSPLDQELLLASYIGNFTTPSLLR